MQIVLLDNSSKKVWGGRRKKVRLDEKVLEIPRLVLD